VIIYVIKRIYKVCLNSLGLVINLLQIFCVKILKRQREKKHHQAPLSTMAQVVCPERPRPNLAELVNKNIAG
jgi:hypothetical protein